MAFIDDVRGRFAQASQSTVQRAKDFSEIKRLEISMDESRRQIHELYGKIGYEVYNAYHDAPLPEVAELIAAVTGLHEKIKACEDQIKEISGVSACPQCGAQIHGKPKCERDEHGNLYQVIDFTCTCGSL